MIPTDNVCQKACWKIDLPGSSWLRIVTIYLHIWSKKLLTNFVGIFLSMLQQGSVLHLGGSNCSIIHAKWNILLNRKSDKAIKKITIIHGRRKERIEIIILETRAAGILRALYWTLCGTLPLGKGQAAESICSLIIFSLDMVEDR
jgi:hypothetical protein